MKYDSIAISGLPIAGKSSICSQLSAYTNWPVDSIGGRWRKRHLEEAPDMKFPDYWKQTSVEDNRKMNEEFLTWVEKGNAIADTRFAHIYGQRTLKVFLTAHIAQRAVRARVTGKYKTNDLEELESILQAREVDEVIMGKQLYGENYDHRGEKLYDLVLDTVIYSVEEEFVIIKNRLKHKIG